MLKNGVVYRLSKIFVGRRRGGTMLPGGEVQLEKVVFTCSFAILAVVCIYAI